MQNEKSPCSIERLLTKRLKGMGFLFFVLCSIALLFACFEPPLPSLPKETFVLDENSILADIEKLAGKTLFTDMQPLELAVYDVLNFYYISALFGIIGVALLVRSKKRHENTEESPDCR